jgi:hypothetical protein
MYGEPEQTLAGGCSYQTAISSGFLAKLVNVWRYRLQVYAVDPENVTTFSEAECARSRQEHDPAYGLRVRFEPCWVHAGEALVYIIVEGRVGE